MVILYLFDIGYYVLCALLGHVLGFFFVCLAASEIMLPEVCNDMFLIDNFR